MILTIKGADFSSANLGTLTTYVISKSIGVGAMYEIPNFVNKNTSVNWVITLEEGYYFGNYSVTMNDVEITPEISGNTMTINIPSITGIVRIVVSTVSEVGNTLFDFDFTQHNLNDYSLEDIFTIPSSSTMSDINYDPILGMNLNNNLPNGLILNTPIDASQPWTMEVTGTFVTPTTVVGNRRAFLGGDNLTPFVFMNSSNTNTSTIGFQISAGSHVFALTDKMIWDTEVTYKIIYNGAGSAELYINNVLKETKTINYTGYFTRILGNVEGKSTAYVWQDVEEGKQSWLKSFKFKYNN